MANHTSKRKSSESRGLTLLEVIIAVAVLGILSSVVFLYVSRYVPKTQATKVLSDYRATREAFRRWMLDTSLFIYPEEDDYASGTPPFSCEDEPALSNTDLFSNVTGRAGWNGPYLTRVPRTPWGQQYVYDNDDDTYDFTSANKRKGVNFRLVWCNAADGNRHRTMIQYIDEVMDRKDGSETGFVRWSTGSDGVINILLSPNENAQ